MKAFRVVWSKMPHDPGIYVASDAGQAKAKCLRSAEEAGYKPKWTELRCYRAPQYDAWAASRTERQQAYGVGEEYVQSEMAK